MSILFFSSCIVNGFIFRYNKRTVLLNENKGIVMFTLNHFIWLAVSLVLIIISVIMLKKYNPDINKVLTAACAAAVLSEFTRAFSLMHLVPSADGSTMTPFLELHNLPFHLCSVQVLLIFFVRFAKEGQLRTAVLAFMYPTCALGAFIALFIPIIFTDDIDVSQAFTHPIAYQYFLWHSVLVILGIYIAISKQVDIQRKHCVTTVGILAGMALISIYLNSWMSMVTYRNGEVVSVDYTPNFFFTYQPPIPFEFTAIWQWYIYFMILFVVVCICAIIFYLPFFKKRQDSN